MSDRDDDHDDPLGAQVVFPKLVGNLLDYEEYWGQCPAKSIERGQLDEFIIDCLTRIVDREDTIHVIENNIPGNRAFIPPVARLLKGDTQKILGELEACITIN